MQTICQQYLEREKYLLSPYAMASAATKGRLRQTDPCPTRTEYQRDRDRILHCKAFRRLMHKTQVFFSPIDEHYRTRMTHTLEVTQIARTIARALQLNEDLTEAAALGHDLGHTPFGHAGEKALQRCFDPAFVHYEQSLRVVDVLENDGNGLNLTYEVRDGIVNHTGDCRASTLEGLVVKFADRIAYINHDIDDACRAGILSLDEIPSALLSVLGRGHGERINNMVVSVIDGSTDRGDIVMTPEIGGAMMELRDFLGANVYTNSAAKSEEEKAISLLISLYRHFQSHPEEMPSLYVGNLERDGVDRVVCDYISGMTDRYAVDLYRKLFIPEVWRGGNT